MKPEGYLTASSATAFGAALAPRLPRRRRSMGPWGEMLRLGGVVRWPSG